MSNFFTRLAVGAIVLAGAAGLAGTAQATPAISYDTTLTNGTYYGSGNPPGHYTVNTAGGIEVGLRAVYRYGSTITPDGTPADTYTAVTGSNSPGLAVWNWTFSVDLLDSGLHLSDITALMTVTSSVSGSGTALDLMQIPDNDKRSGPSGVGAVVETDPTLATRAQNSENLGWFGLGTSFFDNGGFNPWAGQTYDFSLAVYHGATLLSTTTMTVNAVPEPATMTVLGMGLAGLGFVRRRRNRRA